eukprot:15162185-Alexandrium_andersonii.AAC.1
MLSTGTKRRGSSVWKTPQRSAQLFHGMLAPRICMYATAKGQASGSRMSIGPGHGLNCWSMRYASGQLACQTHHSWDSEGMSFLDKGCQDPRETLSATTSGGARGATQPGAGRFASGRQRRPGEPRGGRLRAATKGDLCCFRGVALSGGRTVCMRVDSSLTIHGCGPVRARMNVQL